MRTITLKYQGECRKCGAILPEGATAVYERRVGVFCPGCAPTDPEEIRAYRQEARDRKAERYEGWAAKRRERAEATIEGNRTFTGDIALQTQPGHIPLRARIIKQNDRAFESIGVARSMEEKAESLRGPAPVAGDAERRREKRRKIARLWVEKGMKVDTVMWGIGTVTRINRKTATVEGCGQSGTMKTTVELSWIRPLPEDVEKVAAKIKAETEEKKSEN